MYHPEALKVLNSCSIPVSVILLLASENCSKNWTFVNSFKKTSKLVDLITL
jgi:hypothetical protein